MKRSAWAATHTPKIKASPLECLTTRITDPRCAHWRGTFSCQTLSRISVSFIYKIVSADNPVRIDQICESEIKRVLLGTPFSPPTHVPKLAAKEWGPSGVLIAPKNSHSTTGTRTMIRFPESCFFAFFRLFGSRKARAPEGKNGTKTAQKLN